MRSVILAVSLFLSGLVMGQQPDLDHLMTKRILRCDEIHFNCLILIPQYYRANKIDSVKHIIAYWKNKCGESEHVYRMETLLRLKENTFTQETTDRDLYQRLTEYKNTDNEFLHLPRLYVRPPLMEEKLQTISSGKRSIQSFDAEHRGRNSTTISGRKR